MSPGLSRRLLAASFAPTQTRLKDYMIPRQFPPDTLREGVSPSSSWHRTNFPEPSNKLHYVIGCEPNPAEKHSKVIDQMVETKNTNLTTTLQAANAGTGDDKDPSSHNKTCRKVKSKLNPVPQFQNMDGVSIEDNFEEGDVPSAHAQPSSTTSSCGQTLWCRPT